MTGERHGANLPDEVYDALREIADERHVTTSRLSIALDASGWVDPQIGADPTINANTPAQDTGEARREIEEFERDWSIHARGIEHE